MEKTKLLVFASGKGSNFNAINEAIKNKSLNAEIIGLITDKNCPAIDIANKNNIKTVTIKPKELVEVVCDFKPDYIILAGFMRLIPSKLIDNYPLRIINIHPSLLPSFKGIAAIEQAWKARVKITGVTVHFINDNLDQGVILSQKPVKVDPDIKKLEEKIHKIEHKLYVQTIKELVENQYDTLIISSCLTGENCRYNGKNKLSERALTYIKSFKGNVIKTCPETNAGFGIPRNPIEVTKDRLFMDGVDITSKMKESAKKIISNIPNAKKIIAILKEGSPSCGITNPLGIFTNELRNKFGDNILIVSDEDL